MTHNAHLFQDNLAPKDRLALTRREIISYMKRESRHPGPPPGQTAGDRADDTAEQAEREALHASPDEGGSAWWTIKRTAAAWWHAHPARLALEVAEPVVEKYARAHPIKLVAVAAGLGAVVVLAKPWRLVSVTGLALAALKSSKLSAMAASFLSPKDAP